MGNKCVCIKKLSVVESGMCYYKYNCPEQFLPLPPLSLEY